jgi:hypothetical protein
MKKGWFKALKVFIAGLSIGILILAYPNLKFQGCTYREQGSITGSNSPIVALWLISIFAIIILVISVFLIAKEHYEIKIVTK